MTSGDAESRTNPAALVLTVGTGNTDKLEETLFRPLTLSMKEGDWDEIVLLPSSVSEQFAQQLKDRFCSPDGPTINIDPLPEDSTENDADACFVHFDQALGKLQEEGCPAEKIVVDFTRGTKAMSAALVLAAVRHGVPTLRYINGARDNRGMVCAGHEKLGTLSTDRVTMRHRLDDAEKLMKEGAFAAVLQILPDVEGSSFAARLIREEFREEVSRLRSLAAFWSAWDRLDYSEAKHCAEKLTATDREALKDEIAIIRTLARKPERDKHVAMAKWLRDVAGDLLANGRRRIGQAQYEDALLRGYRVLELIGQFRLFDKEYDSACIDSDDEKAKEFQKYLAKENKGSNGFDRKKGCFTASRFVAARFLKHLRDPLGEKLTGFDDGGSVVKANARNDSILIHGFVAVALDEDSLNELYDRIKDLLLEDRKDRSSVATYCRHEDFGRMP